jgi:hypothetical protein
MCMIEKSNEQKMGGGVPLRVQVCEWRANPKHTFHIDAAGHPPLVLLHLPGRPPRYW